MRQRGGLARRDHRGVGQGAAGAQLGHNGLQEAGGRRQRQAQDTVGAVQCHSEQWRTRNNKTTTGAHPVRLVRPLLFLLFLPLFLSSSSSSPSLCPDDKALPTAAPSCTHTARLNVPNSIPRPDFALALAAILAIVDAWRPGFLAIIMARIRVSGIRNGALDVCRAWVGDVRSWRQPVPALPTTDGPDNVTESKGCYWRACLALT